MRAGIAVALVLALVALDPLASLPAGRADGPGFAVAVVGSDVATVVIPAHGAVFRFNVTNSGGAPDYVRLLRSGLVWTSGASGQALGVGSPEFGRALAAGETGQMRVQIDTQAPTVGRFVATVPFRSDRTDATVSVSVTLDVVADDAGAGTIAGTVTRAADGSPVAGAVVEMTDADVIRGNVPTADATSDATGRFAATVRAGTWAVRADATGLEGATRVVAVAAGSASSADLALAPRAVAVDPASVTVESWSHPDSVWTLGASADLSTLATAPMIHNNQQESGANYGIAPGRSALWSAPFAAPAPDKTDAGPFQALDTYVSVSPDGARVAAMDWNGVVRVLDGATGAPLWTDAAAGDASSLYPPGAQFAGGFATAGATAFSPNGTLLVAGGTNGHVVAYDAASGRPLWKKDYGGEVRALAFSPDGARLAIGSGEWKLHVVDPATGAESWSGSNEFWPLFFIAFDRDGTLVAEGGKDDTLHVWDARTGALRFVAEASSFVSGAGIAPNGSRVLYSDWLQGMHALDSSGRLVGFRRFSTATLAATPDGAYALVGTKPQTEQGSVYLVDANGTILWRYDVDGSKTCASTVSPFPRMQIKNVAIVENAAGRSLTAAAACVGGTVFRFHIPLADATPSTPLVRGEAATGGSPAPPPNPPSGGPTPLPPGGTPSSPPTGGSPSTPSGPSTTPTPSAGPTQEPTRTPTPTGGTSATPALGAAAVAALVALVALARRRG